jgi:hypothetical protein
MFGGSAWESNPPGKFLTPHTGFEDRAAHQRPTRFHAFGKQILSYRFEFCNSFAIFPRGCL